MTFPKAFVPDVAVTCKGGFKKEELLVVSLKSEAVDEMAKLSLFYTIRL